MMKLNIIVCLLTFVFQLNATTFGQSVTLRKANATLREIFKDVRKQTGIDFLYSDKIINDQRKFSIECDGVSIEKVLDIISEKTNLNFVLESGAISVLSTAKSDTKDIQADLHGRIFDSKGSPVSGASVRVNHSSFYTTSDDNGRFTIPLRDNYKEVTISHINYESVVLPIDKKLSNVILQDRDNSLEEVVLNVGYGVTKQSDLTGSVVQVNVKDLEGYAPHQDIASMIQGKAAGVNVQVSSGAPGAGISVNIRGTTSLTGNSQPLWVVDGVPQYNVNGNEIGDILYDLNVGDVETIDILKDASATAIYGSRAANGVIIVTTKKGKNPIPQLDVSFNYGFQKQRDGFRTLTTDEFKQVVTDATRNYFYTLGTAPTTGAISTLLDPTNVRTGLEVDYLSAPFKSDAFFDGETNWWKEMTRTSTEKKLDASLRGSGVNNNYFISLGLPIQEGIIKGSDRNGFTGRVNFDAKIADRLTLGMNFNGALNKQNNQDAMLEKIWNFRPDFPMYDENGKIFDPAVNVENPLITLRNRYYNERKGLNGNTFLQYNFSKDLFIKSSVSISYSQSLSDRYLSEGVANATHKGQANISQSEMANWMFENTASYIKRFGTLHDLTALVGFSMEKGETKAFGAGAQNFPDQYVMTNLSSGSTALKPTGTHTSTALVSAFSRLNYKFADRYLLTTTFRADGSSRFGPDRRWGYFPSGAVAWILNKEKFMDFLNPDVVSQLKIRSSLGLSGSQVLGNNDWRSLYEATQFDESPGYAPVQLGNSVLRWEKTKTWELGLDYALFKHRLTGSIGIYDKLTSDAIYTKNIPSSSSFTSVKENLATISNKGVEFAIQGDVIRKNDFVWSLNFNIAGNKAIVEKINGVDDFIDLYAGNTYAIRMQEGKPLGMWYGFQWSGQYYQSMEEYNLLAKQNPTTGAKIYYQNGLATVRPGDLRFEDINGDGIVNNDDKVELGNSQPKYFGGFGTTLRKGNLSLNVNFVYSVGATRYWYTNSANWYTTGLFLKNYPEYVLDTWSPDNRDAAWPRISFGQGSSNLFSDFWVSKADFLKVSLIRLNYRVPQEIAKRYLAGALDLSVSGTNLFTITNYNGIDPEGNFRLSGGASGMGTDYGIYPSMRSFNFSIRYSLR